MLLTRCPWYVAGPLLGLVLVFFRAAINKPFGAMGGYIEVVEGATRRKRLGPSAFVLLGIVLGGVLFSVLSGTLSPTLSYATVGLVPTQPLAAVGVLIVAGAVMGFGARTAGGCTSGHGLSGMSLASPASIASTATFFATAVALANLVAWLMGTAS